jgi:hypothetical protein
MRWHASAGVRRFSPGERARDRGGPRGRCSRIGSGFRHRRAVGKKPVVAWSAARWAGGEVLSVFHDSPPHGRGIRKFSTRRAGAGAWYRSRMRGGGSPRRRRARLAHATGLPRPLCRIDDACGIEWTGKTMGRIAGRGSSCRRHTVTRDGAGPAGAPRSPQEVA